MKTVVLAAGKGARMGPFTVSRPKGMIPVGNKPILEHVISALVENNLRDIVLVVGYHREGIMSYFDDGRKLGAKIEYVTQTRQMGTAHALWEARDKLDGKFLVLNGSNIVDAEAIVDLIRLDDPPAVLITESDEPAKYGEVIEQDGYLRKIVEKPTESVSNLINTGMYLLDKSFFEVGEAFVRAGKYDIPSILQHIAEWRTVRVARTRGRWADALYPWDLLHLNASVLAGVGDERAGKIEKDVHFHGNVLVGDKTVIHSGTHINGPAVIGEGCEIGPQVVVRPSTSIGMNVRIGPFTHVENSILMDDVSVGPGSVVSNSVVGKGTNVGTRFTSISGPASVEVEGEWHRVENIGALLGDDITMAGGIVVEPGTMVGAKCDVGAMVRLRGNVPNGSTVV